MKRSRIDPPDAESGAAKRMSVPSSQLLQHGLALYREGFFETEHLRNNVVRYAEVFGLPYGRVFHSPGTSGDDVYAALLHRVPVFFGRPRPDLYDAQRLRSVLAVAEDVPLPAPSPARIAISGLVPVFPEIMQGVRGLMGVVHTYGLNFESEASPDLRAFAESGALAKRGSLWEVVRSEPLLDQVRSMYAFIRAACEDMRARTGQAREVVVRIPMIGMGVFSTMLTDESKVALARLYGEGVLSEFCGSQGLHVELWMLPNDLRTSPAIQAIHKLVSEAPSGCGITCRTGSMFDVSSVVFPETSEMFLTDAGRLLVLVNAWDGQSFIGNGGRKDHTIDGFFVAGARGVNRDLQNGSFLLNPWLKRELLDRSMWTAVGVAEMEEDGDEVQHVPPPSPASRAAASSAAARARLAAARRPRPNVSDPPSMGAVLAERLETAMEIYKYPFFGCEALANNVVNYLTRNGPPYAQVCCRAAASEENVSKSLRHVVPVTFDHVPMEATHYEDGGKLRALLGAEEGALLPERIAEPLSVGGLVPVFFASSLGVRGVMGVVNTHSVALCSERSPLAKVLFRERALRREEGGGEDGKWTVADRRRVYDMVSMHYAMTLANAEDLRRRAGAERAVVRVALAGLDEKMRLLSAHGMQEVADNHAEALISYARTFRALDVQVFVPPSPGPFVRALVEALSRWGDEEETVETVEDDFFDVDGLTFSPEGVRDDTGCFLILVNTQWDGTSFIGGGGAMDPTLNGSMVSAAWNNVHLRNGSFLLNSFVNPNILSPAAWKRLA